MLRTIDSPLSLKLPSFSKANIDPKKLGATSISVVFFAGQPMSHGA